MLDVRRYRRRALALSRGLAEAKKRFQEGERSAAALIEVARRPLEAEHLRVDYVELVDPATLALLASVGPGRSARLLVAAYVGNTRLIDNEALGA